MSSFRQEAIRRRGAESPLKLNGVAVSDEVAEAPLVVVAVVVMKWEEGRRC